MASHATCPADFGLANKLPLTCCLQVTFADGSQLAAHYYVVPELRQHMTTFGAFQARRAYLGPEEGQDPFGRAHSILPWDREEQRHVLQDPR